MDIPIELHVPAVHVADRCHEDRNMVLWPVRGTCEFRSGEEVVTLSRGRLLWVPAGRTHSVTVAPDSSVFPLFFPTGTATLLTALTAIDVDSRTEVLCLALLQAQVTVIRPPVDICRQVLSALERRHLTPAPRVRMPGSPGARKVAEALLFDPGDDRSVVEWAELVHTSTRSLVRAFRRETGLTFTQWRRRCRMEAALPMLREGTPVAAVARRVGYADHSAFSRSFRAEHGTSPSHAVLPAISAVVRSG